MYAFRSPIDVAEACMGFGAPDARAEVLSDLRSGLNADVASYESWYQGA
jgi:hypothetical protein